jgi:predicted polyphosphate/ATP-dependent NAD kinase
VERALLMPDRGGIRALLERHFKRQAHAPGDAHATRYPRIEFLDMAPTSTVDDTFAATRLLLSAGVSAIVVLGGDGTHRAVARELVAAGSRVPLVGLSTGTNNAFPEMREPTIAGMAAALFASGRVAAADVLVGNKLVDVQIDDAARGEQRRDIAIVDAVVTHDRSVGARALWKTSSLDAIYLAFAEPQAIGLSAIGALLQPVGRREPGGLAVQLAADHAPAALTLAAPIAPGLVRPVRVAHWQRMAAGVPLLVSASAGTVALDGERELAFEPGQQVRMTLRENAFLSVDVARCMGVAAEQGLLRAMAQPAASAS